MANRRTGLIVLANRSAIILAPAYLLFRIFTVCYSAKQREGRDLGVGGVDIIMLTNN